MSLYNMLCGNNPLFPIYFAVLSTVQPISVDDVPRFRDVYTQVSDGMPQIVLYTRTGGGNREEYEAENDALAAHPLCVSDQDDDFDSTYAHFTFNVPEPWQEKMLTLITAMEGTTLNATPRDKLQAVLLHDHRTQDQPPAQTLSEEEMEKVFQLIEEIDDALSAT